MNTVNWLSGSTLFALGAAFTVDFVSRRSFELEISLAEEKARSDDLLLNILPATIAERLKKKEARIADYCPHATVLFADIAGFTEFSRRMNPNDLVDLLNDLFSRFDRLTEEYGAEKIKTIGDAYMVAAGLTEADNQAQNANAIAALSLAMRDAFCDFRKNGWYRPGTAHRDSFRACRFRRDW